MTVLFLQTMRVYLAGWTWNNTECDKLGVVPLTVPLSLASSLVPALLSVSALPWTPNWSQMDLSTKQSVWSQRAIVSIEIFRLASVMGTICKQPLYDFTVRTASALFFISLLLFVSFRTSVLSRHHSSSCCDASCMRLCYIIDWHYTKLVFDPSIPEPNCSGRSLGLAECP